jgi:leucyl aminopeptidase
MEFTVESASAEKHPSACLAVGIFSQHTLTASAQRMDTASGGVLSGLLQRGDFESKTGQTLLLHNVPGLLCERLLLVGCGAEQELNEGAYRKIIGHAVKAVAGTGAVETSLYLTELEIKGRDIAWKIRHAVEAAEAALYRFDRLKSSKDKKPPPLQKLILAVADRGDIAAGVTAIQQGQAISGGVALARDLGNLPGNLCTPTYLAEQALELEKHTSIKTVILDEAAMQKLGMFALLSVSRGSRQPAKFIIMEYMGGEPGAPPIALVGKGLTFDAGGISIKPAAAMDEMKYDMCGGASVMGTLKAVAELKLPINVVGLVPSCENLPDGDANKPGDIVTSMSGQTIEILNTDAEGRLILCDALTYTERYHPSMVIDIATLTGACVVALGHHVSGLMGNDDDLMHDLLNAGRYAHDRAWQLPLWEEYQEQLDSNFADMANVGGRAGGALIAACFLSRYTKKFKWAHLDVAGTAWKSGKEKGATGRPVPLLTTYLIQHCAKPGT